MSPVVSAAAYEAARRRAAVLDRSERGRIVVSGADRASYLQGLLTNDIAALRAGQGCYAAYLTAQGRMIADMYVYELGDVILENASEDVLAALPQHGNIRLDYAGSAAIVTRTNDAGAPGFDVYVDRGHAAALEEALANAGVPPLDADASEAIRIEG